MTDLLPFDLQVALREPERVRLVGSPEHRATAVAHFPQARDPYRLVVHWQGQSCVSCYAEDGGIGGHGSVGVLVIAPKTRKVWVRIMGRGDGEFDTHISLHPACQEALPVGWRWLDSGPTEIEIREDA